MNKIFYAVALLFAGSAQAVVIDSESAYNELGYRVAPTDYYAAEGLMIAGKTAGVEITTWLEGDKLSQSEPSFTGTPEDGSWPLTGTWSTLGWTGVDRVRLETKSGFRAWAIDNLNFNVVPVPEQGSLALLTLGLIGLGLSAGKKSE